MEQLERDPALQGTTLFALLTTLHPGTYRPTQIRILQRAIAAWRAVAGPEKTVIFEQVHKPAEAAQSDFTHIHDEEGQEAFTLRSTHMPLRFGANVEQRGSRA